MKNTRIDKINLLLLQAQTILESLREEERSPVGIQKLQQPTDFHEEFRAARAAAGLTMMQVVEALNVSLRAVANWEGGGSAPPAYAQPLILDWVRKQ